MARLFPFRSETSAEEGQPRVVDLEGEDADAVFGALSSTTARRIYATLSDEPGTPSDVAEAVDSSIQNVRYHLEKLEDAGLVEVVDTWYSSRGNEMSVYATTDGPLIVTSDQSRAVQLKEALSRFLGGVAALAGGSLLVHYAAERFFGPESAAEFTAADDAADAGPADAPDEDEDVEAFDAPEEEPEEVDDAPADEDAAEPAPEFDEPPEEVGDDVVIVTDAGADAVDAATTLPPGLLFFLGGLAVLTAVTAYWYWSAGRVR